MNTQEAILDLLQKQPTVCADELSPVLHKTRANLQYHLKRMEQAGLIERLPSAVAKSQGRPRHDYALSSQSRAQNFQRLCGALLESLVPVDRPDREIQEKIDRVAAALLSTFSLTHQKTFSRQLSQLVKALTSQGYQARWEARAAGPAVVFHNCPYYDLLPSHPELCRLDAALLQTALGVNVTQQSRIQLPTVPTCRFLMISIKK